MRLIFNLGKSPPPNLGRIASEQALPGPLFNFAAYLGAVYKGVPGAFVGWLGLFGPGVSLIFGFLPFWGRVRKIKWFKVGDKDVDAGRGAVGLWTSHDRGRLIHR